ncbi:hypothetical protein MCAP1_002693 [Malassezia caprae]|uniref:RNA helicase n=1 Tax=Malassezia caprae TaxID=1381934 RepID=A0AAF0E8Z9_9BASI|nr:hypothetical protein MCAP1_002693 [Malassezia caprae]
MLLRWNSARAALPSAWGVSAPAWRASCVRTPLYRYTQDHAPLLRTETFRRLGLPEKLCRQMDVALPHIGAPTPAQSALIPAMLAPNDVILRAHTGSGKSFAVLLALLARPRLLFKPNSGAPMAGISALVLVPSNELALQYLRWARELMPPELHGHMDAVLQCVVRGSTEPDSQCERLRRQPPHVLIGTPTRVQEILRMPHGAALLGVPTLRTLVLDEADALLQLPGRFPSEKQRWKHAVHRTPGLDVLNTVMQTRATYSGGERIMSAGLERGQHTRGTERRPPEPIRRTQYRGAEKSDLAPPLERVPGAVPLQLVCTSATANSVLRHFFGARTGWLRTNTRETRELARWIDLTGLSGQLSAVDVPLSGALPRELDHACVVVDDAREGVPMGLRNLDMRRRAVPDAPVRAPALPRHAVDPLLLEALAYVYASEGVRRAIALVPPQWSVRRVADELASLGVPVHVVQPDDAARSADECLYVLQSTSARGLDVPGLSHVFLVGIDAVQDAVHYTHAAGRVSRITGASAGARPPGDVVTLLRRDPSVEVKMTRLYERLRVTPRALSLRSS